MNLRKNPVINLFWYSWKYSQTKRLYIIFILFSVIANIIILLEPIVIGRVFNSVQISSDDPNLLKDIIYNLLLLVLITIGFWIFHGTSRVMEFKNAFLVRKKYKQEMFDRIMDLPARWHKDHHSGDTIDKVNKSSENLYTFSRRIFIAVQNSVRLVGSIIILILFDWRIALGAVLISLFAVWTSLKFDNYLRRGYQKVFELENYLASAVHDYISNIITIITLRLKQRVSNEIEKRSSIPFNIFIKNRRVDEFRWFLISFYVSMTISLALIWNAYNSYTKQGVIVLGTLFILYRYLSNMGNFFFTFALRYGEIVQEDTAVRAAEIIIEAHEKIMVKNKRYYLPQEWQSIQIRELSFRYKYKKKENKKFIKNNLENIDISIGRGQRIALVGESGSGKSTVLSLIRGLHYTDEVKIYCDGRRLEKGMRHLYEHTALIPQDPEVFNSTILDNITMGTKATPELVEEVMRIARFENVVHKLKKGLKTNVLEKGVSLSGGEKQRLALARGLLMARGYEFLLLDEPTSSVDSENELKIYKNIFEYYPDKTILSAIHRLHLLRFFDYVYIFNKGKIIAEGTFNTLVNDENFKDIWENYSRQK
ncbi:hypothetical protein A2331_03200 [Candidatus Falkowbacteria bacterium RIFOXYB2_FULL_34_18]|uniref:ABC transporter ATP-binding protein n=1 Tax=Candidatus Falkowbacteria bacterium RIFOXYD2_FULL_34_120 TaxID=1798007 RepID=A0A1F5TMW5_9BACT|nr:MAG: hypothetical protein A2500_02565 [Candidatus Falkowbacteria bacterium RIFOXYC12_FULL_34_55]OGF28585.1 MAG: hypothetical protein A2331_03200 [Candidatus Falkowbacteria bacterium RIFOXYB2_FULL_34_18]OGF38026.1 MAG: hypothetical protein A2466_06915 [Candidatus Falkowbacteria bacterium RIFOXYC2_FULL_34_220]OGF38275.1 MAG: hypothetical protein A2515_04950 [Candidatus Falkowbacteria bacterium RIFOXYD12_FULL_34_57]OGF40187.1 MAG: hypothetical protein A2531_01145 [Candidatus Falkowbacteria bact